MTQPSLFPQLRAVPVNPDSAGRRRTRRQRLLLYAGYHPLAILIRRLRLHPDAAPAGDRTAPGLRCRDCAMLRPQINTNRRYLKCELHPSRCEASDVRAWWPACSRWTPR